MSKTAAEHIPPAAALAAGGPAANGLEHNLMLRAAGLTKAFAGNTVRMAIRLSIAPRATSFFPTNLFDFIENTPLWFSVNISSSTTRLNFSMSGLSGLLYE